MTKKYKAFISYSHSNNRESGRKWADWMHQQLESYEVPAELVGTLNEAGETIPHNIYPVFQDEKELSASSDLGHALTSALDEAELLIFLASPQSARSMYVQNELRYFKQIGRQNKIIALILSGEPEYGEIHTELQCFPDELRFGVSADGILQKEHAQEVLAADVRLPNSHDEGYTSAEAYQQALLAQGISKQEAQMRVSEYKTRLELAKLKIIAGVLGVPLGELTKRDQAFQLQKAQHKNRIFKRVATAIGVLALAAIMAGGLAWVKKTEAQKNLSLSLYNSGINKLTESEYGDGAAFIAAAARSGDANAALFGQSMLALQENLTLMPNLTPGASQFSPDGNWLVGYADNGQGNLKLQIWDVNRKRLLKQIDSISTDQPKTPLFDTKNNAYLQTKDQELLQLNIQNFTTKPVFKAQADELIRVLEVSPNGQWLVIRAVGRTELKHQQYYLVDLHTQNRYPITTYDAIASLTATAFTPNSTHLLFNIKKENQTNDVKVFDLSKPQTAIFSTTSPNEYIDASINANGDAVLINTNQNIDFFDLKSGNHWQKPKPVGGYSFVSFNPDGEHLVAANDNKLLLLDEQNGEVTAETELRSLGALNSMSLVAKQPEEAKKSLSAKLTQDMTQELVVLNKQPFLRTLSNKPQLKFERMMVAKLKILRPAVDQKQVFVVKEDSKNIYRLAINNQQDMQLFASFPQDITNVQVLKKTPYLLVRTGKIIHVLDNQTGKPVGKPITLPSEKKVYLMDSSDQKILARSSDHKLTIWEVATGNEVGHYEQAQPIAPFITDGQFKYMLQAGDKDYTVTELATGKVIKQESKQLTGAKFSPDARYLEFTERGGKGTVMNMTDLKPLFNFNSIENPFIAFSHDSRVMAVSEDARYMRLWDLTASKAFGQRIKISQKSPVFEFNADNTRIFVQSDDNKYGSETLLIDAKTGVPLTMPFAQGQYDDSFMLGDTDVLTLAQTGSTFTIRDWEVPGQLSMESAQVADDLEQYYGKVLDLNTGAIDAYVKKDQTFNTWYFQDAYTRTITPASSTSILDVIKPHMSFKQPEDEVILSETFTYHPLARAALAKHFSQKIETAYLGQRYLEITQAQLPKIHNAMLKQQVETLLAQAQKNLQGLQP